MTVYTVNSRNSAGFLSANYCQSDQWKRVVSKFKQSSDYNRLIIIIYINGNSLGLEVVCDDGGRGLDDDDDEKQETVFSQCAVYSVCTLCLKKQPRRF